MCSVTSTKYTFQPSTNRAAPTSNEIAHFTSLGIAFPALQKIASSKISLRQIDRALPAPVTFTLTQKSGGFYRFIS
jgi:hypothetical protein